MVDFSSTGYKLTEKEKGQEILLSAISDQNERMVSNFAKRNLINAKHLELAYTKKNVALNLQDAGAYSKAGRIWVGLVSNASNKALKETARKHKPREFATVITELARDVNVELGRRALLYAIVKGNLESATKNAKPEITKEEHVLLAINKYEKELSVGQNTAQLTNATKILLTVANSADKSVINSVLGNKTLGFSTRKILEKARTTPMEKTPHPLDRPFYDTFVPGR